MHIDMSKLSPTDRRLIAHAKRHGIPVITDAATLRAELEAGKRQAIANLEADMDPLTRPGSLRMAAAIRARLDAANGASR